MDKKTLILLRKVGVGFRKEAHPRRKERLQIAQWKLRAKYIPGVVLVTGAVLDQRADDLVSAFQNWAKGED